MYQANRLSRFATFQTKRAFAATAAAGPKAYKPKSFWDVSKSDAGVYPVITVIVAAGALVVGTLVYFTGFHPDARISKASRKNPIRGNADV